MCADGMHLQRASARRVVVDALLFADGEECNQRVHPGNCFFTVEQRHPLEEARIRGATGQRDAAAWMSTSGIDTPSGCRSTHRGFHMWFIECTHQRERLASPTIWSATGMRAMYGAFIQSSLSMLISAATIGVRRMDPSALLLPWRVR